MYYEEETGYYPDEEIGGVISEPLDLHTVRPEDPELPPDAPPKTHNRKFPWLAAGVGTLLVAAVLRNQEKEKTMPAHGEKTDEREAMFITAMRVLEVPRDLRGLADKMSEMGLTAPRYTGFDDWADMLRRRAAMFELPIEVRRQRRDAFRKGMASGKKQGVLRLAHMFREAGSWVAAEKLEEHARGLPDSPVSTPSASPAAGMAGEYGVEHDPAYMSPPSDHVELEQGQRYNGSILSSEGGDTVGLGPFASGQTINISPFPSRPFAGTSGADPGDLGDLPGGLDTPAPTYADFGAARRRSGRHGQKKHHRQSQQSQQQQNGGGGGDSGGGGGDSEGGGDDGGNGGGDPNLSSDIASAVSQGVSQAVSQIQGDGNYYGRSRRGGGAGAISGDALVGYDRKTYPAGPATPRAGAPARPLPPTSVPHPGGTAGLVSRQLLSGSARPAPPRPSAPGMRPAPPNLNRPAPPNLGRPAPPNLGNLSYRGFGAFSNMGQFGRRYADHMFPHLQSGGSGMGYPPPPSPDGSDAADVADGTLSPTSSVSSPVASPISSSDGMSSMFSDALSAAQGAASTAVSAASSIAQGLGGGGPSNGGGGGGDDGGGDTGDSAAQTEQTTDSGDVSDIAGDYAVDPITRKRITRKSGDYAVGGKPGVRTGMMRG